MLVCKIWWVNCHKQQQKDEETDQNLKKNKKTVGWNLVTLAAGMSRNAPHNNGAWHQKEGD